MGVDTADVIHGASSFATRYGTRLAVIMLAIVAAVAVWIATRHGALLSPDSVTYVSLARNLAAGKGYVDLTGQPNTTFAPGFPAALAMGQIVGVTAPTMARFVNAAAFAGTVVLAWVLLRRHVSSKAIALAAAAFVAVSPTLLDVSDHAWSEPLFCLGLLLFILLIEEAASQTDLARQLAFSACAGLLTGIALLVRYAALPLVAVGVFVLILGGGSGLVRLARVATFLVLAVPLPLAWLVRNAGSGAPYLFGPRMAFGGGVSELLDKFITSGDSMFVSGSLSLIAHLLVGVTVAVGAPAAFVGSRRASARDPHEHRSMLALVAFVVLYSAFVIVSGKASGSSVDVRTVMPILVPSVIIAAGLMSRIVRPTNEVVTRRFVYTFAALCSVTALVIVAASADEFVHASWNVGRAPRGYGADSPSSSPLARAVLRDVTPGSVVTTNNPWTLYAETSHEPTVPTPGPLYPSASLVSPTTDELADASCAHPVYFAWYAKSRRPASNLGHTLRLVVVNRLSDGVLYSAHAAPGECASDRRAKQRQ